MPNRFLILVPVVVALIGAAPAMANPWLGHRVLNMAHQGGEAEHPSATMYAYRRSMEIGADMLELDVHATRDGTLITIHDGTVDRTTNGTGSIYDMTLAEVQKLDAAHWFVPGRNTVRGLAEDEYVFRGVRTGGRSAPLGHGPDDFRVPTLEEVMRAFPDVPLNIEIKGRADTDLASFQRNADLLAEVLNRSDRTDIIVVSFMQDAVDRFHRQAPQIPVAPGITGTALFFAGGLPPGPGTVAIQPPRRFSGIDVATPDFVRRSHAAGYAVHVWFSGQEESTRVYEEMLDAGVDGLMPARPAALEAVLCARAAPRPAGNPNHCGGGTAEAARACRATVRSAGRVVGGVLLRLRRREPANHACSGRVLVRTARRGRRLGSARFHFPYGVTTTSARMALVRRAPAATVRVRVAGRRAGPARRLKLTARRSGR